MLVPIVPGDVIDNKRICEIFQCAPQGGMRRSRRTNTLVLTSDQTGLYNDREEGETIHYTGMGQVGHQKLASQNKTLAESPQTDIEVHFFDVLKKGEYTYRGEVVLAGDPYQETQPDKNGDLRRVWVFPLKTIDKNNEFINDIRRVEEKLDSDENIDETEKERIVKSRIGQSVFKDKLLAQSQKCALCGVSDKRFLIASHIKPWSQSSDAERLDVNNGLLLCPNHDTLFDRGFITFDSNGKIIVSKEIDDSTKTFMNINYSSGIEVNEDKGEYLLWHKKKIYKDD